KNFRLVSAPMSDPKSANWKEEIPHRDDVMMEGLDCFADHYVTREREKALAHFAIRSYGGGAPKSIGFPEPVYTAFPSANPEYQTRAYRYAYNSFITPQSVFDYDVAVGQSKLM